MKGPVGGAAVAEAAFKRAMKKLEWVPERATDRAIKATAEAGLEPVLAAARANIHPITRILERSLRIRVRRTKTGDRFEVAFATTPTGFYGRFVEFGTKHAPAHPFLAPVLAGEGGLAIEAVSAILRDALRQEVAQAMA